MAGWGGNSGLEEEPKRGCRKKWQPFKQSRGRRRGIRRNRGRHQGRKIDNVGSIVNAPSNLQAGCVESGSFGDKGSQRQDSNNHNTPLHGPDNPQPPVILKALPQSHPLVLEMMELKHTREQRRMYWAGLANDIGEEWENAASYDRQRWEMEERLADQKFQELSGQVALAERGLSLDGVAIPRATRQYTGTQQYQRSEALISRQRQNRGRTGYWGRGNHQRQSRKMKIWTESKHTQEVERWVKDVGMNETPRPEPPESMILGDDNSLPHSVREDPQFDDNGSEEIPILKQQSISARLHDPEYLIKFLESDDDIKLEELRNLDSPMQEDGVQLNTDGALTRGSAGITVGMTNDPGLSSASQETRAMPNGQTMKLAAIPSHPADSEAPEDLMASLIMPGQIPVAAETGSTENDPNLDRLTRGVQVPDDRLQLVENREEEETPIITEGGTQAGRDLYHALLAQLQDYPNSSPISTSSASVDCITTDVEDVPHTPTEVMRDNLAPQRDSPQHFAGYRARTGKILENQTPSKTAKFRNNAPSEISELSRALEKQNCLNPQNLANAVLKGLMVSQRSMTDNPKTVLPPRPSDAADMTGKESESELSSASSMSSPIVETHDKQAASRFVSLDSSGSEATDSSDEDFQSSQIEDFQSSSRNSSAVDVFLSEEASIKGKSTHILDHPSGILRSAKKYPPELSRNEIKRRKNISLARRFHRGERDFPVSRDMKQHLRKKYPATYTKVFWSEHKSSEDLQEETSSISVDGSTSGAYEAGSSPMRDTYSPLKPHYHGVAHVRRPHTPCEEPGDRREAERFHNGAKDVKIKSWHKSHLSHKYPEHYPQKIFQGDPVDRYEWNALWGNLISARQGGVSAAGSLKRNAIQPTPCVLWIGNLGAQYSEADLRDLFEDFEIDKIEMPWNEAYKKPAGFAFVHLVDKNDAYTAIQGLNNARIRDRPVQVRMGNLPKGSKTRPSKKVPRPSAQGLATQKSQLQIDPRPVQPKQPDPRQTEHSRTALADDHAEMMQQPLDAAGQEAETQKYAKLKPENASSQSLLYSVQRRIDSRTDSHDQFSTNSLGAFTHAGSMTTAQEILDGFGRTVQGPTGSLPNVPKVSSADRTVCQNSTKELETSKRKLAYTSQNATKTEDLSENHEKFDGLYDGIQERLERETKRAKLGECTGQATERNASIILSKSLPGNNQGNGDRDGNDDQDGGGFDGDGDVDGSDIPRGTPLPSSAELNPNARGMLNQSSPPRQDWEINRVDTPRL